MTIAQANTRATALAVHTITMTPAKSMPTAFIEDLCDKRIIFSHFFSNAFRLFAV
jgi:hypothetical protein